MGERRAVFGADAAAGEEDHVQVRGEGLGVTQQPRDEGAAAAFPRLALIEIERFGQRRAHGIRPSGMLYAASSLQRGQLAGELFDDRVH